MVDDGCYSGCLADLGRLEVVACTKRLEFNRLISMIVSESLFHSHVLASKTVAFVINQNLKP
jgi:hypothetical protein